MPKDSKWKRVSLASFCRAQTDAASLQRENVTLKRTVEMMATEIDALKAEIEVLRSGGGGAEEKDAEVSELAKKNAELETEIAALNAKIERRRRRRNT